MAAKRSSKADADLDSRSSRTSDLDNFPMELTSHDNVDGLNEVDTAKNAEALGLITSPDTNKIDVQVREDDGEPEKSPSKCAKCMAGCLLKCRPCMTEYNPPPSSPTRLQRVKYACLCPPHGPIARVIALVLTIVLFWATLWGVTGPQALPGGNFFALVVLVVLCSIAGALVRLIRLPGLLGKLINIR